MSDRQEQSLEATETVACVKGRDCALNKGARHCFSCGRNWPPDETWPLAWHDWTLDERGVSNSSPEYLRLVDDVERLIRGSAHALISGNAKGVARVIVSNLAHKHGMRLCDDALTQATLSPPSSSSASAGGGV